MKTKTIFIITALAVLFFCLTCHAETSDITYDTLFQKDSVIDIRINIDENDLEDMYTYPKNEEYHSADITVAGHSIQNIGFRTKGNSSLYQVAYSDSKRYSYRIKFDKYVKGQTLLGLDELCLNNGFSDPSYTREYLHYELLRYMGQTVPETVFCNLYINDKLYGFYLAVEAIDNSFLDRNFGDRQNTNLYKMEQGSSLVYRGNENYPYAKLKAGKDKEKVGLKNLIRKLNGGEKHEIESVLDVDGALIHIAANTVLCNYDSYNSPMKRNYYLYENDDGIFTVLAWDLNMSFGGFSRDVEVGIDEPMFSGNMESSPLISRLLEIDAYKQKYYGYIRDMMAWLDRFEVRVTEVKTLIFPYVQNDPSAFYTVEVFEHATTLEEHGNEAAEKDTKLTRNMDLSIVKLMADRLVNLKAQFDGSAEKTTKSLHKQKQNDSVKTTTEKDDQTDEKKQSKNNEKRKSLLKDDVIKPQDTPDAEPEELPVIRVHVNGHIIRFPADPFIENGATLVGFRAILEALGAEVSWNGSERTVTATKEDTVIVLTIGSDTAYVNGEPAELMAAPSIISGSTVIPLRFISETLGMKVSWDEDTRLIAINKK